MTRCVHCGAEMVGVAEHCPSCIADKRLGSPPAQHTVPPQEAIFVSGACNVVLLVLLYALALGAASCWGGCTDVAAGIFAWFMSGVGVLSCGFAALLASRASGGASAVSFLLLAPCAIVSIPAFVVLTANLAFLLAKNVVAHVF